MSPIHAPGETRPRLLLPDRERQRIDGWARAAWPLEACGLLLGLRAAGSSSVLRATSARNTAADAAQRYEVHPEDHLAAELSARAEGLEVVGVWHSHPNGGREPSQTDRAAAWAGLSYLIVGLGGDGEPALGCWRLENTCFVEEQLLPSEALEETP